MLTCKKSILLQLKLVAAGGDALFVTVTTEICERLGVRTCPLSHGLFHTHGGLTSPRSKTVMYAQVPSP